MVRGIAGKYEITRAFTNYRTLPAKEWFDYSLKRVTKRRVKNPR